MARGSSPGTPVWGEGSERALCCGGMGSAGGDTQVVIPVLVTGTHRAGGSEVGI